MSDYYKHRERELKRNPDRFEEEQKATWQWAIQVAKRNRERQCVGRPLNAKEGMSVPSRAAALFWIECEAKEAFMQHPAATEADFQSCWPGIRQEILKEYTLGKLASNREKLDEIFRRLETESGTELRLVTKDGAC
jgi:hypothetical protein